VTLCHKMLVALVAALALVAAGCGGGGDDRPKPKPVVLVAHDSFVIPDDLKQTFQRRTGSRLRILQTGDAGETLTKALLTAGNPQGDVLFGIDSNLLSRALDADLLEPYRSPRLARVQKRFVLDPQHRALPVDHGDVCVNYDRAWFAERGLSPPRSLDDLAEPAYDGLFVVQNAATSTPGLAFLLATIAKYGEDGWQDYWRQLRENEVLVVDGWEEAYNVRFSGSGAGAAAGGDRPLVVSYASSPPAEVIFRTPRPKQAPTGVIEDSCFRQIEFAGILRGSENEDGARELIDFMLSTRFQEEVPLSMFVFPVISGARLPPEFRKFAVVPDDPLELPPKKIEANRDRWVKEWTSLVLR
jgi:thiamine transport system substrate-binding protein